jgi:DNA-binding transcriptional LysR family regulator
MRLLNLPTDLLRTFVTIVEVDSYTHAANLLGRSQPAISLQMKRLEELIGQKLILRTGRDVVLTEQGEVLIAHARQMLRLNDLVVSQFDRSEESSVLRVGLPLDYGVRLLQSCITNLVHQNDKLRTEIRCDLSRNLIESLRKDELDIAVAVYQGGDQQFLFSHWQEQPIWVGAAGYDLTNADELPLVAHPFGCVYRDRMTEALKQTKRRWRVAFSSPGIGSLQQAILDGLGVSCLTGPTMLSGLQHLKSDAGLPDLGPLHIGLFYRQTRLAQHGHQVVDAIANTLEAAIGPKLH